MNEAQENPEEQAGRRSKVCAVCGTRYPHDALFCPNDGAPLHNNASADGDDPYLGQVISGHIEIRQLVGVGAMGRVYRAFQRGIDRDVAVKILHRELSANAQLVARFTREAKVASRLQHPNVVQVFLAGQLPDRALYMVMEYLDGLSLQSALAGAGGALPLSRALHVTLQLCEAAGEAHDQGIVHRDLKPENVMLVRRGTDDDFVKVLDFGIARINWGESTVATAAGLIFGTARYISPEGAHGEVVGPASDVYAIVTLLYQMLSGRTPFEGDQAVALLVQQIHDPAPAIRDIPRAAYVAEPICDVIMRNLAKNPGKREPDARALGHAIIDAASASGLSMDDISRPLLRRGSSVMRLPPVERTKQLELSPELADRLAAAIVTPPPPSAAPPKTRIDGPPTAATANWEPPEEFVARLASALVERTSERISSMPPVSRTSSTHTPAAPRSVDETLNDADVSPSHRRGAATVPGDVTPPPRTQYETPASNERPAPAAPRQRRARGLAFVLACFVVGALAAALVAWRMGKLGETDEDRFVARAADAMFKNHFQEPPGENVRDITDEGLRRFPNDRRLLDVRTRASTELVSQAMRSRTSGDVAEALRLAKLARELDRDDQAAQRLVDQYEAELATVIAPQSPPLKSPVIGGTKQPPPILPGYKAVVVVEEHAKAGQPIDLVAKVVPAKGDFEGAGFLIAGPDLAPGFRVPALPSGGGFFKGTYTFATPGKFDVAFTTQAEGKTLRATRSVTIDAAPPPPSPPPSASVKWM